MTIIGLLASLAVPRVSRSLRWEKVRGEAAGFARACRTAATLARSRGLVVWVEADLDTGRYWLSYWSGQRHERVTVRSALMRPRKLPPPVRFLEWIDATRQSQRTGTAEARFDPNGTADSTVVKIGAGEMGCTVGVSSATGRAMLCNGLDANLIPADRIDLDED